jgi:hypothetical protein
MGFDLSLSDQKKATLQQPKAPGETLLSLSASQRSQRQGYRTSEAHGQIGSFRRHLCPIAVHKLHVCANCHRLEIILSGKSISN